MDILKSFFFLSIKYTVNKLFLISTFVASVKLPALKQNKRLCKIDAEINEAHIKKKNSNKLTFLILRPAFFMAGNDIGKLTTKAIYDPRTSNKIVHFRPACKLLSLNEMASLWESKIGRKLPRTTLTNADLLSIAASITLKNTTEHHKINTKNVLGNTSLFYKAYILMISVFHNTIRS